MTCERVSRPRSGPWWRARFLLPLFLLTSFFMAAASSPAVLPSGEREPMLKAQFIIELAASLRFPREKPSTTPFLIVVMGESPFNNELETYSKGRSIQGRPVQIRYLRRVPEGEKCDLLFICRSEAPRARAVVAWCHSKGILTVAEGDRLAAQGVMVNLMVEDTHLMLGLNQRVLAEEGFTIGAQVLKVARILVPSK